jgi:hypothetical protein
MRITRWIDLKNQEILRSGASSGQLALVFV